MAEERKILSVSIGLFQHEVARRVPQGNMQLGRRTLHNSSRPNVINLCIYKITRFIFMAKENQKLWRVTIFLHGRAKQSVFFMPSSQTSVQPQMPAPAGLQLCH
jgi:hypothetical protein